MNWFRKLPGFQRSSAGLEVRVFRVLPAAVLGGTLLPIAAGLLLKFTALGTLLFESDRGAQIMIYALMGLVLVYWSASVTVGIGCILVMVMKGPAYIADEFPTG